MLTRGATRREDRGFVHRVGQVCTGEAGRAPRDDRQLDVVGDGLAFDVDRENRAAAFEVGAIDDDLAIETARTQQGRVEDVGPVGGGDQDHARRHVEAVHLDEELVERLLALVVTATQARAALTTDGVDLVDEDDGRCRLLGLLEQVPHPAGADADEHLDEVRSRDREERHAGLARDGPRQQGLARTGRPEQQHALRDLRPHGLEPQRVLEEVADLLQLFDGFVRAGDVRERDLGFVLRHLSRLGLAELQEATAALHVRQEVQEHTDQQHDRQQLEQQRDPDRLVL